MANGNDSGREGVIGEDGLSREGNPIGVDLVYVSRDGEWRYCIEELVTKSMASVRCPDKELRNYPTYYFKSSYQFRVE